ncbi:hypothetical protein TCAL_06615 [Tigriopus californicus]|uniref:N-formylglutamate amidohydrolase n=1 Tax=Tigriopus californicus TaxID=6832 RepID=A0A553PLU2_TIGCA|nr:uncharacterized protein LOC131891044 [Tigriopus californicus]TRY78651.1 hypothetical protein TCAL_06615 [Tigriopus californicus]|eukprot:TCALIF_06615-PA protein Name:"Protein of unknown function" AED:0.00 eAED:0.00 QI:400/1/1/1/0.25/0.4/5/94/299
MVYDHCIKGDKTPHHPEKRQYIEYQMGNLPLILSVPHGGMMPHPDIPDRTSNNLMAEHPTPNAHKNVKVVNLADLFTIEMAIIIADTIEEIVGKRPHLIICHLRRTKIDINRDIVAATHNNPLAKAYYHDYHSAIRRAKAVIGHRGLLFDIHGQAHMQNSTEIGYLVSKAALNDQNYDAFDTSIRALAKHSGLTAQELVVGHESFGAFLEAEGYRCVPSPRQPSPGMEKYFRGGYITRQHGSMSEGHVDAIQLEIPKELRQDGGPVVLAKFAKSLGCAIVKFFQRHYERPEDGHLSSSV